MEAIWGVFREAFSDHVGGKELSISAMGVRFADRRMLGKYSAFDTVLAVMIGAVLGRTINGGARLWASLMAVVVLAAFHWVNRLRVAPMAFL